MSHLLVAILVSFWGGRPVTTRIVEGGYSTLAACVAQEPATLAAVRAQNPGVSVSVTCT